MIRDKLLFGFLAAMALGGLTLHAQALDIVWDGEDWTWDFPNWNGGFTTTELGARRDGSDGYASPNEGETFIISGADSIVTYDANFLGSDFRMKQGSSLRIEDGATWRQPTDATWLANRWTEFDGDNLIIDNGNFERTGSVPGEGGGALIFGSWLGNDNFSNPLSPNMQQITNIEVINGGRLVNEGQLWFGSWDDTSPNGTTINMTINDGTVDLTGGHVPLGEPADADLVFSNRFPPTEPDNQPTYTINFTGPGSITVDSSGIVNAYKDEFDMWQNLDPVTYEDLWEAGILRANGQSGADGADFSQFFTVSGALGMDDYTLMSMVTSGGEGIPGDYSGNGLVEQSDLDLVLANWGDDGSVPPETWVNDLPSGTIDQPELDRVLVNWGNRSAAGLATGGAVPEPATCALLLLAGLAAMVVRR